MKHCQLYDSGIGHEARWISIDRFQGFNAASLILSREECLQVMF